MPLLNLAAKTVPSGTTVPGTLQDMVNFMAQYLEVQGLSSFTGINVGEDAPTSPEDRERPWFRKDPVTGRTMGWWWWDGSAWAQASPFLPKGSSTPVNPVDGEQFYHTSIAAAVVYRAGWKLDDGNPSGTLKWVDYDPSVAIGSTGDFAAGTYDTVLGKNPGYSQFGSATDRTLVAAGTKAVRTFGGAETHTLAESEMPAHTHNVTANNVEDVNGGSLPLQHYKAPAGGPQTFTTDSKGGSAAHNNMQPYYVSWLLKKS